MTDSSEVVVWIAGVGWDDLTGTDKRIVLELGRRAEVLWVDPPRRGGWVQWRAGNRSGEYVAPGVRRVRIPGLPGFSRWPIRVLTRFTTSVTVRHALSGSLRTRAIVVANPTGYFPPGVTGKRVLYVTDDWIAGAKLMGLSPRFVTRTLSRAARESNLIATVSPGLIERMKSLGLTGIPSAFVLPNGAPPVYPPQHSRRAPVAGLVGTLNERLDLALLEGVVDAGIRVHLIGPRTDRDPEFGQRLDRLISRSLVEWTDRVPADELSPRIGVLAVGLTPYTDSAFNRASFPLKTFDYLAAGVPVISSDLPASRWIGSECVQTTENTTEFVSAVKLHVEVVRRGGPTVELSNLCRELASRHSWEHRAQELLDSIDGTG